MPLAENLALLKSVVNEVMDLRAALALLGWDQQVNMPKGGAEDRSYALSTLASIAHQKATAPEIGDLLEKLSAEVT
jgi:carboxypeptidase Taq